MGSIASPRLPGETIADKYRVERILGQGGMGVVVAARHLELDQTVAIKFLFGNPPPNARERFMREARAAALVKSEHVCRVHDVGKLDSGEPYIVMEYLEGIDLAEKIADEGQQPVADAVGWIIQACDALSSAHASNIVHRDLKPANLFLQSSPDSPPSIKVVDFGISKLPSSGQLTESIVVMGSPLYMSPEQLASTRDADARSDIWSLGVVLYELVTGEPPFSADSLMQLAVRVREIDPPPPRSLRADLPAELEEVILKCLKKNPSDRYPSVHELVEALRPFAPPDAAALVTKLTRRARRVSEPNIDVLGKTTPISSDKSDSSSSSRSDRLESSQNAEGKTLDPVQTIGANDRRTRWGIAAAIAAAAITAGIVSLTHRPANATAIVAAPLSASAPLPTAEPAPEPPPPTSANAPPPASTTVSVPSAPSVATLSHPPVRDVPRKTKPTADAGVTATVSTPAPTASTATAATATPSSTSGPKKRVLDRDYKDD